MNTMGYILFDTDVRYQLLPFTHTRPVADIRCGILTLRERWEKLLAAETSTLTEDYLQEVYPIKTTGNDVYINGSIIATEELVIAINNLKKAEQLVYNDIVIASNISGSIPVRATISSSNPEATNIPFEGDLISLNHVWDIFSLNGAIIKQDFNLLTKGKTSQPIPEGVLATGKENIFIEEGATVNVGCILNGNTGPIYIGKAAELLEGVMMRGPVAICDGAVVKMGAKIYADTTIGNGCKVGGENSNVVYFANSNKGHDGYLGNAVIGEWCNLGADTNCSNLKNNYDSIKIWDEHNNKSVQTGLTFCGLLMGDHSKCGINTMFNTGTVVGVSANIYGGDFLSKFIPSFAWGGSDGMTTYRLERAVETANRMMGRRKKTLSDAELKMYQHIFEQTTKQRELFANN